MKRLSWKYMAGLVDGEGCIDARYYKNKAEMNKSVLITPRLRVALAGESVFILEIMQKNHGGWMHYRKSNNPIWQDSCSWMLQGPKLRPFLQNIANHMYLKKEQAKFAIWIYDTLCQRSTRFPAKIKRLASNMMKAMKTDPQRLSEAAIQEITNSSEWKEFGETLRVECKDCRVSFDDIAHEARGFCRNCYQRHKRLGEFKNRCDSLAAENGSGKFGA